MTALVKTNQEDTVLCQAIDNIATYLGGLEYQHYILDIEDVKGVYGIGMPAFLDFSKNRTVWRKINGCVVNPTETAMGDRYVFPEHMVATIERLGLEFVFKNIIAAIEDAMALLKDEEFVCYSINYSGTDLTFAELMNGLGNLVDAYSKEWRYHSDPETKTFSIIKR
jgi:hypothetical protein